MEIGFGTGMSLSKSNPAAADPIGDALRADAVAYWKMDEASGTRNDSTAGANHLDQSNEITSAAGKVSNAISLENIESYLRRSSDASFAFGDTSHAFAFWARFSSLPSGSDRSIFLQDDAGTEFEYAISISDRDGDVVFNYNDWDFNFAHTESLTALQANTWYFVIFEYDTTTDKVRFFVNNNAATEFNIDTPVTARGNRFIIGRDGVSGIDAMAGLVDEFLVLNRVTTSNERTYLYNGGTGRTLYE